MTIFVASTFTDTPLAREALNEAIAMASPSTSNTERVRRRSSIVIVPPSVAIVEGRNGGVIDGVLREGMRAGVGISMEEHVV